MAVTLLLLVPLLLRRCLVRRLALTPRGIRFVRLSGPPVFVSWEHITRIRSAGAREVLLHEQLAGLGRLSVLLLIAGFALFIAAKWWQRHRLIAELLPLGGYCP